MKTSPSAPAVARLRHPIPRSLTLVAAFLFAAGCGEGHLPSGTATPKGGTKWSAAAKVAPDQDLTQQLAALEADQARRDLAHQESWEVAVLNGAKVDDRTLTEFSKLVTRSDRFEKYGLIKDDDQYIKHKLSMIRDGFGTRITNPIPMNRLAPTPESLFREVVAVLSPKGYLSGTGTLIARDLVLTAGHVIAGDERLIEDDKILPKVYLGADANKRDPKRVIGVKRCLRPAGYSKPKRKVPVPPETLCNDDLAVLLLEREVTDEEATPAEFAESEHYVDLTDIYIVGFGPTGVLDPRGEDYLEGYKNAGHVAISGCDCDGRKDGRKTYAEIYGCTPGKEFVALDPWHKKIDERTDTTHGDSGGPAFIKDQDDSYRLAGVTSRSVYPWPEDLKNAPRVNMELSSGFGGIYVRVDRYREFIDRAAKELRSNEAALPK